MPVTIDVLIGFAVVMLVLSLAATALIQVLIAIFQLRGWHLLGGIASLLRQIDPSLDETIARDIAWRVVRHPMLARGGFELGGVVQREELVQLLLGLAAGVEPVRLGDDAEKQLRAALAKTGIDDPKGTLRYVRATAMRLEHARPELAVHVLQSAALISEASSDFLASMNAWFDSTMDRVSQSFSGNVRVLTVVVALALALAFQVDSVQLINRLAIDKDLRAKLVAQATDMVAHPDSTSQAAPADTALASLGTRLVGLRQLATSRLIELPGDVPVTPGKGGGWDWGHVGGMLLTAVMVGLGAPFWFNTLKTLLNLRSSLAAKEDMQREQRVESTAAPPVASVAPTGAPPGEQGDLPPVG